ncbi:MAG TPA: thioredoxin domain-containing protein, partial [Chloroflexota bacterium]|nr:thioredoxin domain-containing protein [Chloroflexota bacterium]
DAATRALVRAVFERFLPNKVVALKPPSDAEAERAIPLLADRPLQGGQPTAYVCQNFTCNLPVNDAATLADQLAAAP